MAPFCVLDSLQQRFSAVLTVFSSPCLILDTGQKKTEPLTFRQGLWVVMSHGPYVKLVIGFLFTSLAFMVILHFIICLIFDVEVVIIKSNFLHLSFTATVGKLCPFHHIRPRPSERLSEYSLGNHGECFYFPLLVKSIISMRFGRHLYNLRPILRGLS